MILYVLRESLHVIGVIDTWSSLIWTTKLKAAGNFELCVAATPRNKKFLQANRFLARSDMSRIMYINTIEDKSGDETQLIVSGYSSEGVLRKRAYPIWSNRYHHGDAFTIESTFEAINPLGFRFDVSELYSRYTGDVTNSDLQTDMETYIRFILGREGDEIPETEPEVDSDSMIFQQLPSTFFIDFDYKYPEMGLKLSVSILKEIKTMPSFMFSEDIGNISDVTYSYSEEGCASCIIALINKDANITYRGEIIDEKEEPIYIQTNLTWSDLVNTVDLMIYKTVDGAEDYLRRNEKVIYVDPIAYVVNERDTTKTEHRKINSVPEDLIRSGYKYGSEGMQECYWSEEKNLNIYYALDQQATLKAMEDAINKELLLATENIQGTVKTDKLTAYNVGDIAVFRDNDRLHDYYKRIEEIQECFDSSGYRITPTFGEPLKELKDVVQFK